MAFFARPEQMRGQTAVITGGASGIGLATAQQCSLHFGMRVVLADVDEKALQAAVATLPGSVCIVANVSSRSDNERLLREARKISADGNISFVFLNAGVMGTGIGVLDRSSEDDWRWVIDVNFMGVLLGIKTFVPALLTQDLPCLLAVTASDRALDIGGPPGSTASYSVSKHAVLALMESLEGELRFRGRSEKLKLAVLCPGPVQTKIWDIDRQEKTRTDGQARTQIVSEQRKSQLVDFFSNCITPEEAVKNFFADLAAGSFICNSEAHLAEQAFARRSDYILQNRWPSDCRAKL